MRARCDPDKSTVGELGGCCGSDLMSVTVVQECASYLYPTHIPISQDFYYISYHRKIIKTSHVLMAIGISAR